MIMGRPARTYCMRCFVSMIKHVNWKSSWVVIVVYEGCSSAATSVHRGWVISAMLLNVYCTDCDEDSLTLFRGKGPVVDHCRVKKILIPCFDCPSEGNHSLHAMLLACSDVTNHMQRQIRNRRNKSLDSSYKWNQEIAPFPFVDLAPTGCDHWLVAWFYSGYSPSSNRAFALFQENHFEIFICLGM